MSDTMTFERKIAFFTGAPAAPGSLRKKLECRPNIVAAFLFR
jgi:hypothetical protein